MLLSVLLRCNERIHFRQLVNRTCVDYDSWKEWQTDSKTQPEKMLVLSQSVFVLGTLNTQPTTNKDKISCIKTKYSGNFNTKKGSYVLTAHIIFLSLPHSSCSRIFHYISKECWLLVDQKQIELPTTHD
jgi:hypothetical protein